MLTPALFGVGLLLASCGEADESRSRAAARLGGSSAGAPLGAARVDRGILADQTAYRPTDLPGLGPAGTGGGGKDGGGAVSAEKEVRAAVQDLVNALADSEVELALGSFESAQVSALSNDDLSVMFTTFESFDTLRKTAIEKLGEDAGKQVVRAMTNVGDAKPKVQTLDATHVGVTPNVALALLGPKLAGEALAMAQVEGVWKAQLETPLSAATATEVVKYHQALQATLHKLSESVGGGGIGDVKQLVELLKRAMQGEPVDVPAAASAPAGEGAGGAAEAPPAEGGKSNENENKNKNENDNGG